MLRPRARSILISVPLPQLLLYAGRFLGLLMCAALVMLLFESSLIPIRTAFSKWARTYNFRAGESSFYKNPITNQSMEGCMCTKESNRWTGEKHWEKSRAYFLQILSQYRANPGNNFYEEFDVIGV